MITKRQAEVLRKMVDRGLFISHGLQGWFLIGNQECVPMYASTARSLIQKSAVEPFESIHDKAHQITPAGRDALAEYERSGK